MQNLIYSRNKINFDQLKAIKTPEPMGSKHRPVPHHELVEMARRELDNNGFTIEQEEFGISEGGMNLFSGFALRKSDMQDEERTLVMGLRNSHTQKLATSMCIGTSMMVCENLCFSSDIKLSRKHVGNIINDLPPMFNKGILSIQETWDNQTKRIDTYKQTEADEVSVLNKLVKAGLVKQGKLGELFDLIENGGASVNGTKGAFSEYRGTLWNLYNAITESYKTASETNLMIHLPQMTMRVQQILDRVAKPETISEEDKALALPA